MKIKLWGARGSLPAPMTPETMEARVAYAIEAFISSGLREISQIPTFLRGFSPHLLGGYGGNTLCVEVTHGPTQVIIDGGSSLRLVGQELMKGPCAAGKGTVDLLMTHFHWDHLIGLPFFGPIFVPGNIINVYAVQPDLEKVFQDLFKKPYFPVPFSGIGGTVRFHRLEPRKSVRFGELEVTPYQLDHPDPCWGYQFKAGGKVYSHCVDTECVRVGQEELGEDLPLYQGVDLMTFDAQYTLQESLDRVNWGHAAAGLGLDIAMREGIKRILFMHHDPASSDERISQVEAQTRIYYNKQVKTLKGRDLPFFEVNWEFAREGMVVEL